MAKIRETQLADQMAFEEKFNQITLEDRFQQTIGYINRFQEVFWKLHETKSVAKEIKEALVNIFKAKDTQFKSFERGVEG